MKILLDENIDVRFKKLFIDSPNEVYTVRDMQWNGIKNDELLKLLETNNFDCWIVVDKNIPYHLIIVLDVFRNTLEYISKLYPSVLIALDNTSEKIIVISE